MGLSAEDEEGLAVDEEGVAAVLFDEGGHGGGGRLTMGFHHGQDKGNGQAKEAGIATGEAHMRLILGLEDANFLVVIGYLVLN